MIPLLHLHCIAYPYIILECLCLKPHISKAYALPPRSIEPRIQGIDGYLNSALVLFAATGDCLFGRAIPVCIVCPDPIWKKLFGFRLGDQSNGDYNECVLQNTRGR